MPEEKKAKKSKKLALNKETVHELSDEQLGEVAGGLKTGGNQCGQQSLLPACRSVNVDCPTGPDPSVTCPPPLPGPTVSCVCPLTG